MDLLTRFPILIWLGAALLGWIAGEMIVSDVAVLGWFKTVIPSWVVDVPVSVNPQGMGPSGLPHYGAAAIGAAVVIIAGYLIRGRRAAA
jgi:predicted tellurium resistance membrane protein TerC